MKEIGIGLIGTGFMGKCHALAFHQVAHIFGLSLKPKLQHVVDIDLDIARGFASQFGFERYSNQWQALLEDPTVGLISITAPNYLHATMCQAALDHGKHVLCEKPLTLSAASAFELKCLAEKTDRKTMIGYNYLKSPAIQTADALLRSGELGALYNVSGYYHEDYMADPSIPFSWRCSRALAGNGALGDLGCHLISLFRKLIGPISSVTAAMQTVIPTRQSRAVENEDQLQALVQFQSGVHGTLSLSRIAWGKKMGLSLDITGEQGSLSFNQERMNELDVYRKPKTTGKEGFQKILMGPAHPDYGHFCPAPGHGLGYNDLKVIEIKDLLEAIVTGKEAYPNFTEGYEIELVSEAMCLSAKEERRIEIASLRGEHRFINV